MVSAQILSKVLLSGDNTIIEENMLTEEYFVGYVDEFNFIQEHIIKYGNVPDKETFLERFDKFEIVDVHESDKYLIDTIREENLYRKSVPVLKKTAELMKIDSNMAMEYWQANMNELGTTTEFEGVDIVHEAKARFDVYQEHKDQQDKWFFESGFKELDEITHGIQREDELFVIVARTNQGKSWVLEKMCAHVWQIGFNVGYISPEMSADSIGFRFDTLMNHTSNRSLMWGNQIDEENYQQFIDSIVKKDNKFIVSTPRDFAGGITVSKLRIWVKKHQLDMIAIDGITYLTDERYRKNDTKTTSLTNISEDLMALSGELKIPILVVVQANRGGVINDDEGTPELESIRDSDGISHNASKVISIRQKKDHTLEIGVKKQRFGSVGDKLNYMWDIDTGVFTYIESNQEQSRPQDDERPQRKKKEKSSDMF